MGVIVRDDEETKLAVVTLAPRDEAPHHWSSNTRWPREWPSARSPAKVMALLILVAGCGPTHPPLGHSQVSSGKYNRFYVSELKSTYYADGDNTACS